MIYLTNFLVAWIKHFNCDVAIMSYLWWIINAVYLVA